MKVKYSVLFLAAAMILAFPAAMRAETVEDGNTIVTIVRAWS